MYDWQGSLGKIEGGSWAVIPTAGKSNSQLAENYTKPKWELEGGKAKEKHTATKRAQLWLSCKKFFVKIAGREFLNAFKAGEQEQGAGSWLSYAKHRRLLLQNAAGRVISWHGAHAAGLKNGNSNSNSDSDSHSHSDWDSNCPRKPPTLPWTLQWSRGLSPETECKRQPGRARGLIVCHVGLLKIVLWKLVFKLCSFFSIFFNACSRFCCFSMGAFCCHFVWEIKKSKRRMRN